jgi:hypothetical protein
MLSRNVTKQRNICIKDTSKHLTTHVRYLCSYAGFLWQNVLVLVASFVCLEYVERFFTSKRTFVYPYAISLVSTINPHTKNWGAFGVMAIVKDLFDFDARVFVGLCACMYMCVCVCVCVVCESER